MINEKQAKKLLEIKRIGLNAIPIKKVSTGRAEVFDLFVPDGNTFIGNKIINHNTCNFSNLYGGTAKNLAEAANIPIIEAKKIHDLWWSGLSGIKNWKVRQERFAEKNGFVKTHFGRKIMLSDAQISAPKWRKGLSQEEKRLIVLKAAAFRQSINFPVQGSSADILKIAMVSVHHWIKSNNLQEYVRMLLTIHDEIVFEIRDDALTSIIPEIVKIMCKDIHGWKVPLVTDVELSKDWGSVMDLNKWLDILGVDKDQNAGYKDNTSDDSNNIIKEVKEKVVDVKDFRVGTAEGFRLSIPVNIDLLYERQQLELASAINEITKQHPGNCQATIDFIGLSLRIPKMVDKRGFTSAIETFIRRDLDKIYNLS